MGTYRNEADEMTLLDKATEDDSVYVPMREGATLKHRGKGDGCEYEYIGVVASGPGYGHVIRAIRSRRVHLVTEENMTRLYEEKNSEDSNS